MKGNSETAAMVRTTYALTQLAGSAGAQRHPAAGRATVNVRVDPGEDVAAAFARIEERFDGATEFSSLRGERAVARAPFDGDRRFRVPAPRDTQCIPRRRHRALRADQLQRRAALRARVPAHVPLRRLPVQGRQRARASTGSDEHLDVDSFKRGVGFYVEFIQHLDQLGK